MDWCPVLVPSFRSILKHTVDKLGPAEISKTFSRPTLLVFTLHFVNVGSKETVKWVPAFLSMSQKSLFEDLQISRLVSPDHDKGEAGVGHLLHLIQVDRRVKLAQMVVLF